MPYLNMSLNKPDGTNLSIGVEVSDEKSQEIEALIASSIFENLTESESA